MTLNRLIFDYDRVLICGPVFPHEVAGFSGGAKYLFPGIAGPDIINFTHWLGALVTSMRTIGVKDTPVRRVIHRAAEFVPTPDRSAWRWCCRAGAARALHRRATRRPLSAAADLSAQLNIITVPRAFQPRALDAPAASTTTCGRRPRRCTRPSRRSPMAAR